jgi:regulatory protein YycH of two-component signal transduction system YycFG
VSPNETILFHVKNNVILKAMKNSNGNIDLDFPTDVPTPVSFSKSEISIILQGFNFLFKDLIYTGKTTYDFILEITSDSFEKLIVTDFQALARLGGRGIIVTRRGNTLGYDFTSRWFGPW